jgi:hypothetical protein
MLALALAGSTEDVVRQTLLSQGVESLARRTKVSIARFVRLALLLGQATLPGQAVGATCGPNSGSALHGGLPRGLSGSTVLLAVAWATASSRADLLAFLLSLHEHHSTLTGRPVLRLSPALLSCPAWRNRWCTEAFDSSDACAAPSSGMLRPLSRWAAPSAEMLELLAFYLCARGSDRPEVAQGRHGHRGQAAVPDCVESVLHDTLSLCLWDAAATAFRPSLLPSSADAAASEFFSPAGGVWRAKPGETWFGICTGRPGLHYMRGGGLRGGAGRSCETGTGVGGDENVGWGRLALQMGFPIPDGGTRSSACPSSAWLPSRGSTDDCYELYPSLHSFTRALSFLVGLNLEPPEVG